MVPILANMSYSPPTKGRTIAQVSSIAWLSLYLNWLHDIWAGSGYTNCPQRTLFLSFFFIVSLGGFLVVVFWEVFACVFCISFGLVSAIRAFPNKPENYNVVMVSWCHFCINLLPLWKIKPLSKLNMQNTN